MYLFYYSLQLSDKTTAVLIDSLRLVFAYSHPEYEKL